jgi:hypothetical protein
MVKQCSWSLKIITLKPNPLSLQRGLSCLRLFAIIHMLCRLFSANNRGLNAQLTDLHSILVQIFDIGSYQLKVILILETRPEFAHSAMVCVRLHDVLVVAGHAESCALHWYDLVHDTYE